MYINTIDEKPGSQCLRMKRHHYAEDSSSDEEVDTSVKVIVVVFGKTS